MKRTLISIILTILLFAAVDCQKKAATAHVPVILKQILSTKSAIENTEENGRSICEANVCIFLTVWDFDGTILKGDCTEGLEENGTMVYDGAARLAVDAGFAGKYTGPDGFRRFWDDYQTLDKKEGHVISYSFLVTAFAGARVSEIQALSEKHFENVIKNYYFDDSIQIIRALQKNGVKIQIVSASPEFIVAGSSRSVEVPLSYISGNVSVEKDGLVSDKIAPPINYADGKTKRIELILKKMREQNPGARIFILGGFGNSYHTDGAFLEWISKQTLPAGKTVSVMINGGRDAGQFKGLFMEVTQEETVNR